MKIICQEKEGWCGPACVQEVLRRRGIKKSQKVIARGIGTKTDNGTDPWAIVYYLMGEGFQPVIYAKGIGVFTVSLDSLGELRKGTNLIIVDWMNGRNDEDGHYALLEYVDKDCVILNDPDYPGSLRMLKRETFEKQWYDYEDGKKIERLAILV